jgi:CPA1 family monovalent cation:H+ antiporter
VSLDSFSRAAGIVIVLLACALVVGVVANRLRFPYAIALLLVSLPLSDTAAISFAPSVLIVFLPALVFEAAWNVDLDLVRRWRRPIAFLAIPGVGLTALVVGCGLWLAHVMPFLEALLLGAIVSATDPIAVTAAFKQLAPPRELATIVEGESLFNDGIAAILYTAIVAIVVDGRSDVPAVAFRAAAGSVGGLGVGLIVAAVVVGTMRWTKNARLEIIATVVAAFGAYLAALRVGTSGIFASLIVGIALRAYRAFPSSTAVAAEIDAFWSVLAFIANSLVFLLLGLRIQFDRIFHEPLLLCLTLGLVAASRAVLAYVGLPLLGINHRGWNHIVMLAGMRGALSLALALVLPDSIPFRATIIDAVFGVVAVTLVVQGLAIGPALRGLRLRDSPSDAGESV